MSQWPSEEDLAALRSWDANTRNIPYRHFPAGPTRDRLRRWGMIERWNPLLKVVGRIKPWRLTDVGRAVLAQGDEQP